LNLTAPVATLPAETEKNIREAWEPDGPIRVETCGAKFKRSLASSDNRHN